MNVVTRIAPSPTGRMHIGTVRTALFNYLFAKKHNGKFLIRIEDTDKERNKQEWTDAIWEDFSWCGIVPDARYVQSEHIERHKNLLRDLVDSGRAYISKVPSKQDASRDVEVVRLKNPGTSVTFDDLVRGSVTFDTTELGDFIIARSIDDPLFHFAVVADDQDEGITHVLRAEEHISNTPRQILIQEALGFPRPAYGHIPLILAPDRSKLSKRKHAASIDLYRAQGYLPEALINYLALLGWNPGDEREFFTLPELIDAFSIEHIQKSGAIFDIEKLRWYNRHYLLNMPAADFEREAFAILQKALEGRVPWDEQTARAIAPLIKERISVWNDLRLQVQSGEYDYFFADPTLEIEKLPGKNNTPSVVSENLSRVRELLSALSDEQFNSSDALKESIWSYAEKQGRGAVLWPLRYALSGRERSPDPFTILSIIGKAASLRRIDAARIKIAAV